MILQPARTALFALGSILLAGCGGYSLWPFGEGGATEQSRRPANAAEYRCAGGKGFFVRDLDAGAGWLVAPRPDTRPGKAPGAGRGVREIAGRKAPRLAPPAKFAGCKRADAAR